MATETKPATPAAAVGTAKSNAQNSVFVRMAERFGMDPVAFDRTIRATMFPSDKKDASPEQAAAFLIVADQYQLNPFVKEIYAFPNKAGGITPIVSVDGWHTIAQRHPQYAGHSQRFVHDEADDDLGCETTIHRKDFRQPIVHTEWLSECYRNTEPWKMKKRMLGHKSFIQTARIAFGFAGIYDPDEGDRIIEAEVVSVTKSAGMAGLRQQLEEQQAPTTVEEIEATAEATCRAEGAEAARSGASHKVNPYQNGDPRKTWWQAGFAGVVAEGEPGAGG